MVFQSYALFPNMTVAQNIGYGLKIRGISPADRKARIAELVALTGIEGLEGRKIDQLSGGQRQRVALARAVAIRPRVLLLDEPLTALDASLRERLRGELNKLLRSLGITTVYVTHDQAEAMVLGDRIVVMRAGAIAQVGDAASNLFRAGQPFCCPVYRRRQHHRSARRSRLYRAAGRARRDRRASQRIGSRHGSTGSDRSCAIRRGRVAGESRGHEFRRRPPAIDRGRRCVQAAHHRCAEHHIRPAWTDHWTCNRKEQHSPPAGR